MTSAALLAAAALLLAPPSSSEPPAPAPAATTPPLTLAAALDLAARRNLDLVAARLRRSVAQAEVQVAGQFPNPAVIVSASQDTPHGSLVVDQPLPVGGRRGRGIEVAQRAAALTDLEIEALERRVRRETREAYYGLLAARASTAQRADALALARRLRATAQARFDSGDVPRLEVIQADLEVARAEADLTVQRQDERVALSRLNALLNEPADTACEAAGSLEDAPPMQSMADLASRAERSNPDLERLAQEIVIEEGRGALLRAERVPDLTVELGADFDSPGEFRVGPRGGLGIELPLFSRKQGELARSAAAIRTLESETEAARRAVAARVEAAYYEWNARQTQVDLYRRSLVPAARDLEGLAEESYRAGKANLLTVLDAQRNVQQVGREYRDSLLALQAAFAELEETVGEALD